MEGKVCEYDIDCPQNEVCYTGVTWFENNYNNIKEINKDSNCYCSTYYAYARDPKTGECSVLTDNTYALVVVEILYIILASIGLILCFVVAGNMKLLANIRFNAATTTLIFLSLSYVFFIIQLVVDTDSTMSPMSEPLVFCDATDNTSDKCAKNDLLSGVFNALMMVFAVLACLNVSLMWIEACSITGAGKRKNVSRFRRPMIAASIIYFAATLVTGPILGQWQYAVYVTIPFYLGIVACYSFGYYLMHLMLLEESSENVVRERSRIRNKTILSAIKRTSRLVVLIALMLIGTVTGYTYIGYTSWEEFSPVGVPSLSAFFDFLEPGLVVLLNFSVHRYIYLASTRKAVVEDMPTSSTRNLAVMTSIRHLQSAKVQTETQDQ